MILSLNIIYMEVGRGVEPLYQVLQTLLWPPESPTTLFG